MEWIRSSRVIRVSFCQWQRCMKCCGTVMICYGSGSGSSSRSRQILSQFSNNKKFVQNLAFSLQCQKQHYFPESWHIILDFWNFITIYIGSWSRSGSGTWSGTGMHSSSGSPQGKRSDSYSTALVAHATEKGSIQAFSDAGRQMK